MSQFFHEDPFDAVRIGIDIAGGDVEQSAILYALLSHNGKGENRYEHLLPYLDPVRCQLSIYMSSASLQEQERVKIERLISSIKSDHISFIDCSSVIEMWEEPFSALLAKKKSASLTRAFSDLKEKRLDAVISTANTGAFVLGASTIVGRLSGIHRPALTVEIPSLYKASNIIFLDVGASIGIDKEDIASYAFLGTAYYEAVYGAWLKRPTLGIFNIGVEPLKGFSALRDLYKKFEKYRDILPFEFIGNSEPSDIFSTSAPDIVITSGFAGNVFLKTAEALLKTVCIDPDALQGFKNDRGVRHSAILLGVDGLIYKCHGNSSEKMICDAVEQAVIDLMNLNIHNKIKLFIKKNTELLSLLHQQEVSE